MDATGGPHFLNRFLGINSETEEFETHSSAIFSHFENVMPWSKYLEENQIPTTDYPYDPDYSALHHLLDEGWLWMLRFNNGITSAGLLLNRQNNGASQHTTPAMETWNNIIARYPSLEKIFEPATLAEEPGELYQTGPLQRRLRSITGDGWAALPHTAGFTDPMHSTGIAHTLSGVEKLVPIIAGTIGNKQDRVEKLYEYEQSIYKELNLIDLLVAGSYRAMPHFKLFSAYTMLYFIAAITYEQERLRGEIPAHFLSAGHDDICSLVAQSYRKLTELTSGNVTEEQIIDFIKTVKTGIAPYNSAGLMDPVSQNMYRHTAVEFK